MSRPFAPPSVSFQTNLRKYKSCESGQLTPHLSISPSICLFIPSLPSIFRTNRPSATVVCCHHRASLRSCVCLHARPQHILCPCVCILVCIYMSVCLYVMLLTFVYEKHMHIQLDLKTRFSHKYTAVFRCQPVCPSGGLLAVLLSSGVSSCLLLHLVTPSFFSHISGVKRGVCSQINHFPEDADFDHDGAEYVLRKSIAATVGMYDELERSLVMSRRGTTLSCKITLHYFLKSSIIKVSQQEIL